MARYTVATDFIFGSGYDYRSIVPDAGASLDVKFWSGAQWVADPKSPITSPSLIFARNNNVRITPAGGGFTIDEEQ